MDQNTRRLECRSGNGFGGELISLLRTTSSLSTSKDFAVIRQEVGGLPHDEKRAGISKSEIILAFPVKDSKPLIAGQNVYAFLPVKSYGLSVSDYSGALNSIDVG